MGLPAATIDTMPAARARRRATKDVSALPAPLVRLVSLDLDADALAAARRLLSEAELLHADRGAPPVARRRSALRAGLRRLAGDVLDLPPAAVPLHTGEHGRPELDVPGVDVACSRAGDLGLVALAVGRRIGVDVERVAPWRDSVLDEGWLSPAERSALLALDPPARGTAVARCWTRKEAVVKAGGTGLTRDLAGLRTGVAPGRSVVGGWLVAPVPMPGGLLASIATSLSDSAEEHAHGRLGV